VLRRLAICAAFATCCFLNTWVELAQGDMAHYARFHPGLVTMPAVLVLEAAISGLLFAAWEMQRRWKPIPYAAANLLFLFASIFPAGIVSVAVMRASPFNLGAIVRLPFYWVLTFAVTLPVAAYCVLRPVRAGGLMRRVFLYSIPVLCVVVFQACSVTLFRFSRQDFADGPAAARLGPSSPGKRVVWIVFDELSEAIVFDRRPASLTLPNFDKLRARGFRALAASSPNNVTENSMPSLILGLRVEKTEPVHPGSLLLSAPGRSERFEWRSTPNVFDRARELGFNTALAGWALPYGRLINGSLTECTWTADWLLSGVEEPSAPQSLVRSMIGRLRNQAASFPLIGHIPGMNPSGPQRAAKIARFQMLMKSASAYAADPSLGLVLLHLPAPHPPGIYDRAQGRFSDADGRSYLDNTALADRALGELTQAIERAGLARETTLIVSGDHGWRTGGWSHAPNWTKEEQRASENVETMGVPFLVRFPGQDQEFSYATPFNTMLTADMILAILRGELHSPQQFADWISGRAKPPIALPAESTSNPVRRKSCAPHELSCRIGNFIWDSVSFTAIVLNSSAWKGPPNQVIRRSKSS
jgi:hypothetical protein